MKRPRRQSAFATPSIDSLGKKGECHRIDNNADDVGAVAGEADGLRIGVVVEFGDDAQHMFTCRLRHVGAVVDHARDGLIRHAST
jgi:hypothetical protein